MFVFEEGVRLVVGIVDSGIDFLLIDDEIGLDSEMEEGFGENYVRRRKVEEVLFIFDLVNMDWIEVEKEKVNVL